MAHDDTFQPDPDRSGGQPQTGTLRSSDHRHPRVDGPDLVDQTDPAVQQGAQGTASVVLGAAGLPDRESLQESGDTGAADLGAALGRESGLGGTRGDDLSLEKTPGQISGAGGTRGTGAGTGQVDGSSA
jgi:hypothetical protein